MTVKTVKKTEGNRTVEIPEFSPADGEGKRETRYAGAMNGFYVRLREEIFSFASREEGEGRLRVRGIDGSFRSEQTGASRFRITYFIRGRFLSSDRSGGIPAFRLSRVIETVWDSGVIVSFSVR